LLSVENDLYISLSVLIYVQVCYLFSLCKEIRLSKTPKYSIISTSTVGNWRYFIQIKKNLNHKQAFKSQLWKLLTSW